MSPLKIPWKYGCVPCPEHPVLEVLLLMSAFSTYDSSPWAETVMKQCDLDSMSIDELFMLHERLSATLAAKITAEKKALVDRLKQADMRVH
jgi:hypothetical protein